MSAHSVRIGDVLNRIAWNDKFLLLMLDAVCARTKAQRKPQVPLLVEGISANKQVGILFKVRCGAGNVLATVG